MDINNFQKFIDSLIEYAVQYGFQVIGALIVLVIGFFVAKWISNFVLKLLLNQKADITLGKFLAQGAQILVFSFAVLIALGKFGITIAPFIAALSALAFGASFAIQGPLSNYGAGLSIILSRPFTVGDTITVKDVSGIVQEVKLACTILTNEDGVCITIPNNQIVGEILHNSKQYKVVNGSISIAYQDSPQKAVQLISETLKKFSEVTQSPKPQIGIQTFADSSINITYRFWVPTVKYYQIWFAVNQAVYQAITTAGIQIPFPQRDIHIISQPSSV